MRRNPQSYYCDFCCQSSRITCIPHSVPTSIPPHSWCVPQASLASGPTTVRTKTSKQRFRVSLMLTVQTNQPPPHQVTVCRPGQVVVCKPLRKQSENIPEVISDFSKLKEPVLKYYHSRPPQSYPSVEPPFHICHGVICDAYFQWNIYCFVFCTRSVLFSLEDTKSVTSLYDTCFVHAAKLMGGEEDYLNSVESSEFR